jgi:transposase
MKNKDARSLPTIALEDLRRKAVKVVRNGKTHEETGKIFGVTRQTVTKWVKKYRLYGVKGLKAKPKGRPPGGRLKPWQAARIAKTVVDRCPEQMKLPFYLWTRKAVSLLIEKKYRIHLSTWTVGRYLKRWGFSPQKPMRRAFEQNPEEVRQWLEKEYPKIKKQAKKEGAVIYWGDEMGVRSDHATGRTYGLRGKTPIIYGTGQRFGCNMISAITNKGHLCFRLHKKRFNTSIFVDYMRRLVQQSKKKVFFIIDRHPVHRSDKVHRWVAKNIKRIHVYYLPGYSPELNPDEILNQDVKSNAVGRRRAHNQKSLMSNVRGYLCRRQKHSQMVVNYFHEDNVRYAFE